MCLRFKRHLNQPPKYHIILLNLRLPVYHIVYMSQVNSKFNELHILGIKVTLLSTFFWRKLTKT